jgi:spermidine/putrescine transport system substrate-binding protein
MMGISARLAGVALAVGLVMGPAAAEGRLNVYNWGDYINPEVLQRFSEEFGVEVSLDTYSSNEEMLAKIQAGATGYDIIFPSVHMQDIMHSLGLLQRTGINESPNFGNIDPDSLFAKTDPDGEYCLPYAWGTVGIVYNKSVVPEVSSWEEFFAIPQTTGGKITLLDDMREVMAVGLIMTGHSVNSDDPDAVAAATEYLLQQRPNISAFTYDTQALIATGDIAAGHFFTGVNILVKERPDELAYVIPAEGATMYQENICVLASAPNVENALKFLEFYLRPEIAALNVAQQMNGTPNIPARELTPEYIRDDPNINLSPETMARLQVFEDLGPALRVYDRAWNRVRTAQ